MLACAMKQIKTLSNEALLEETKSLAEQERMTTLALIECLAEVEYRKLYFELGYSSLWQFSTLYLKLSEGAAQRRINAARLSKVIPETKDAIADGSLSHPTRYRSRRTQVTLTDRGSARRRPAGSW